MTGADFDKYMKDQFRNDVEPISDADWKTFEAVAISSKPWWVRGKWALVILLFFSISGSIYFWGPNHEESPQYHMRETKSFADVQQVSEDADIVFNQTENPTVLESTSKNESQSEDNLTSTSEQSQFGSNNGTVAEMRTARETPQSHQSAASAPLTAKASGLLLGSSIQKQTQNTDQSKRSFESENDEIQSREADERSQLTDISDPSMGNMALIPTLDHSLIDRTEDAALKANANPTESITLKSSAISLFGLYEWNNSIGQIGKFGAFYNYTNKRLTYSAGLGIAHSSGLNWNQSRTDQVYGFDAYEKSYNLQTNSYTYLFVPIQLSYQFGGVHELYAGAEFGSILNAAQSYSETENSGMVDEGYLYNFGNPEFILFTNVGYQYEIVGGIKLGLGMSYSPQSWSEVESNPFGGYFRLTYLLKK